jgi:hypothetical protein
LKQGQWQAVETGERAVFDRDVNPSRQSFQTILFSELGGFCILDIAGTLALWADNDAALPLNLLEKLSEADEVSRLAARAAILAMTVDESDDYMISVDFDAQSPATFDALLGDERGWAFRSDAMGQHLLGFGHLQRWSVNAPGITSFSVPEGEYDVRCRWGLRGDHRCIDLVFAPTSGPPRRGTARALPIEVSFYARATAP